jgi:hypothetical protein
MVMTMDVMGQKMSADTKMGMSIHYDVVGQQNDVYDIRMSYGRIVMSMTAPAAFSINSASPETSSDRNMGDIFKALTEVPMDIQLNKKGKIISVQGIEKLTEKFNAMPNEQMRQMFSQQFTEATIRAAIEQTSSFFPDRPVAIGESWNVVMNVNSSGINISNQMELTLRQVQNNIAIIDCKGTLSTSETGELSNVMGMDAKISAKGEQTGTIQMDMRTGWLNSGELNQKMLLNIEAMGQTIPQEIVSKTIVTAE